MSSIIEKAESPEERRAEQIVFGWNSIEDAAASIFNSLHNTLLEGRPVFLYRNTSTKSDLSQVAVVANVDYENNVINDYGVGVITSGYSMLYPHINLDYLKKELLADLKKWKVEEDVINTYNLIIKELENYGNK